MIQACRSEAKGKGLKGPDLRQAVQECVAKQNPRMGDRLKCRMAGKDKGLQGDELKTYVRSCVKGNG
jgi:hypothetical protein